ncbi:hypothetical protein E4U54_002351, partial [Claviceps lovelessii]
MARPLHSARQRLAMQKHVATIQPGRVDEPNHASLLAPYLLAAGSRVSADAVASSSSGNAVQQTMSEYSSSLRDCKRLPAMQQVVAAQVARTAGLIVSSCLQLARDGRVEKTVFPI